MRVCVYVCVCVCVYLKNKRIVDKVNCGPRPWGTILLSWETSNPGICLAFFYTEIKHQCWTRVCKQPRCSSSFSFWCIFVYESFVFFVAVIEGVRSFQYKASTFISLIERDIYPIENCPYLSVGSPFSIHTPPGYVFFSLSFTRSPHGMLPIVFIHSS